MYIIKRGNKRFGKKMFFTYDEARNYARKVIRKDSYRNSGAWYFDLSDNHYHNPSLSYYGFKVVQRPDLTPF